MSWRILAALGCLLWCTALACELGPVEHNLSAELPPLSPSQSRIILYMVVSNELPGFCPHLTVDDEPVGRLCVGTFIFVDQSPGAHQVGVGGEKSVYALTEEAMAGPIDLKIGPGGTAYVQVQSLAMSQMAKIVLTRVAAANGLRDISSLRLANRQATP
jgi:hypothetical protein